MIEKLRKFLKKHGIVTIAVLLGLLILFVTMARPYEVRYVVFRLSTKVFANFEVDRLKYPDSRLVESEVRYTTKVTKATYRTYRTTNDIKTVLDYFERNLPGFVHMRGSLVKTEPTYRNELSAGETEFNNIFQALGCGTPYIEVYVYPSTTGGTTIQINEHWSSMGVPSWLSWL
jgi:hypothetical protein